MALAYTPKVANSRPDNGVMVTDIVLDGSYPAAGYALDLASIGMLDTPDHVEVNFNVYHTATLCPTAKFSPTGNKLMFLKSNTAAVPTECANTDLTSGDTVRIVATGRPRL